MIALVAFAPASLVAQSRPTAADSAVYARARQLVANGNGAAGRVLVDSMLTVAEPSTPAYAEALYWRATLAATGADAESDYRRIVVDFPLSPRSGALATLIRAPAEVRAAVDVSEPQGDALMRISAGVKASFDPAGVLNPGRMYAGI